MQLLKQSSTEDVPVLMIDAADHISGKTGLTLAVTLRKKAEVGFNSISPTVTELGAGWYNLAFTIANTDTLGPLLVHVTAGGADPFDDKMQVVVDLPGASVASVVGNVGGNVNGTVVGAFSFAKYTESRVQLLPGDLLVFFTDGITEPENEYGEMFGEERLVDLVARNAHHNEEHIIDLVLDSVRQFARAGEAQDDMTILLARRV